jgi:hypothetical protein
VHARGVGPLPIPVDQFNLQKLVDAIKFMLEPEVTSTIYLHLGKSSNLFFLMLLFLLFDISRNR